MACKCGTQGEQLVGARMQEADGERHLAGAEAGPNPGFGWSNALQLAWASKGQAVNRYASLIMQPS